MLYFGQSARLFELQPGMVWPDGSWALAKLIGMKATRFLAGGACLVAAVAFGAGGVGVFFSQSWWMSIVVVSACCSSLLYILFWNGRLQRLADQGGIGLLINAAIALDEIGEKARPVLPQMSANVREGVATYGQWLLSHIIEKLKQRTDAVPQ